MSNARSPSGVFSTTVGIVYWPMSEPRCPSRSGWTDVVEPLHDVVDDPVLLRLFGIEPAVPLAVALHGRDRLAGVLGDQPQHRRASALELLGVDLHVGGRAAETGRALVHEHLGVRQAEPLARGPRAQQELAHAAR